MRHTTQAKQRGAEVVPLPSAYTMFISSPRAVRGVEERHVQFDGNYTYITMQGSNM